MCGQAIPNSDGRQRQLRQKSTQGPFKGCSLGLLSSVESTSPGPQSLTSPPASRPAQDGLLSYDLTKDQVHCFPHVSEFPIPWYFNPGCRLRSQGLVTGRRGRKSSATHSTEFRVLVRAAEKEANCTLAGGSVG